jgi:HSP20 family protein
MALIKHDEASSPVRMFDRFFADWPAWFKRPMLTWPEDFADDLIHVDEYTEDSTLVIKAELPGIDPEKDVEITVDENTLRIEAHRREEERTEDKTMVRKELRYGSFARLLPLPVGVGQADVRATYKDGILEIRVPMPKETAPEAKKVPVTKA